jgi:DNA ligase-1
MDRAMRRREDSPHPIRESPMPTSRRHLLLTALATGLATALPSRAARVPRNINALQLPVLYSDAVDPAGCLVSEKYDGVRGHWDGATLRFRSGRAVPAPAWFSAQLPRATPLDGELWLARGRFDDLSGVVRKTVPVDADWRALRYMVFELPGASGPFAERAQRIRELVAHTAWPQLVAVEQSGVASREALRQRLADVVAQGGEGLVLHRADALFRGGRSDALMKLKPELDTEAVVVAHHAGQGRFEGQLGALEVRTPEGRRFLIGTGFSDAQRRDPPPVGSSVTYRYRDLTATGLPRFASFLRVHHAL